jgi:endoglucanase
MKSVLHIITACIMLLSVSGCQTKFKAFKQKDTGPKTWMQTGINQLENGDFSRKTEHWNFYFEGGKATAQFGRKEAKITISSTGNVNYGVQFYYDGFRLYRGGRYTLKFTASAEHPKGCETRIQLNGGDYHPYVINTYTFTETPKEYSVDFEMKDNSDMMPRLAFNLGQFAGRDKGTLPCDVIIGDVSLTLNNTIAEEQKENGGADIVRINQIGYRPGDVKTAFVKVSGNGGNFSVIRKDGTVVFTGRLGRPVRDELAYEYTAPADFSAVTEPGTYTVKSGSDESFPFTISSDPYTPVLTDLLSYYTLSRCGTAVTDPVYGHPVCHTGKARIIGTNDYAEADGGWHDAGDYGRYVVPAAKAVTDLLLAYSVSKDTYSAFSIPGEVKYELDWMMKMQRGDGGVYHKITCKKFPPFEMPQFEKEQLVISPVSTPATADFAGSLAFASIIYRTSDSVYADRLLAAAEHAWQYLETHAVESFSNPSTVETGAYADNNDTDERYFAAAALCAATRDRKYADAAKKLRTGDISKVWKEQFGWAQMEAYGDEIAVSNPSLFDSGLVKTAKSAIVKSADEYISQSGRSGFKYIISTPGWGSNMEVMNGVHLLADAAAVSGKKKYIAAAHAQIDYIFGCNPMTECYVTGYGTHSPRYPHHRPSIAVKKPMKGMMVGGPDGKLEDPFAQNLLEGKPPLLCYLDNSQSYSTNEVTIYWNSALVYAVARLYFAD